MPTTHPQLTPARACAWGKDLVKPLTCQSADWFDMGLTLVDGLSTLKMMGLDSRFREGLAWVASGLSLDNGRTVNVFEATIRLIGGLLSAHALATPADGAELTPALLERAVELGARLLPAFEASPSGIPFMDVNVSSGQASTSAWTHMSYLSEAATLTLEWTLLSRYSGRWRAGMHAGRLSLVWGGSHRGAHQLEGQEGRQDTSPRPTDPSTTTSMQETLCLRSTLTRCTRCWPARRPSMVDSYPTS